MKKLNLLVIVLIFTPGLCFAQASRMTDAFASIVDGVLALEGEYIELSGIEALSAGGHLSLQTVEIPGSERTTQLTVPFDRGTVVSDQPEHVIVGVLGEDKRINASGTTMTSILYDSTQAVAEAGDLTLNIGIGDCTPTPLQVGVPSSRICYGGSWNGGVDPKREFQLINGEIYLVGAYDNLASIEITSATGNLSLGTVSTGFQKVDPFESATVVQNTANSVVIGVLGAGRRVDIEGETVTSIQYAETLEIATSDLNVRIGLGDSGPLPVTVGEDVTIVDGAVTLVGSYSDLAGIEAVSNAGHLSLDVLAIEASTLFAALESNVSANDANRIAVSSDNRVSINGLTPTGIFFAGDAAAFAAADVQLFVALGDEPPIALPQAVVPEPTSRLLFSIALLGALGLRGKTSRSADAIS